ncbi:MAG TPA: type II CAAX endopeptidase family protein [Pyrinomonadaceae bacterium]|nr:type II CAAX endopeptidase family protein [Pyrinomonadaceae bacterium]
MREQNESTPDVEPVTGAYALGERPAGQLPPAVEIDPNDPPWGVIAALLTWFGSVVLLYVVPIFFLIPYVMYKGANGGVNPAGLLEDKTAIFLAVLSTLPVHILTLGGVWALVTRFGKRPFWRTLGWSWSRRVGFWTSAGLAVLLLAAGLAFTKLVGGEATDLDKVIQNSAASRITLALLAALTAPLVEELVYRGVLYPAMQRAAGMFWAVLIVAVLFTLPHVPQYMKNIGVIIVVFTLSLTLTLVRAFTGKLLPCFVMHMVFNGIQSVLILVGPYVDQTVPEVEHKAPALAALVQNFAHHLF